MRLIVDSKNNEIVFEETKTGKVYITGVFSECEKPNANGRTYRKDSFAPEVDRYITERVQTGSSYGACDHPPSADVSLKDAAILIESLEWEDTQLWGKALVLSTPSGEVVKGLLRDGAKMGLSSRGLGNLTENNEIEGYHLITWDVVGSPSSGHWANGILESKSYAIKNGLIVETTDIEGIASSFEPVAPSAVSPETAEQDLTTLMAMIQSRIEIAEYAALVKHLQDIAVRSDKKREILDEFINDLGISDDVKEMAPHWKKVFEGNVVLMKNKLTGTNKVSESANEKKTLFQQMLSEWCQVYRSKYL